MYAPSNLQIINFLILFEGLEAIIREVKTMDAPYLHKPIFLV